jgi:hypothetical protein
MVLAISFYKKGGLYHQHREAQFVFFVIVQTPVNLYSNDSLVYQDSQIRNPI